MIVAILALAIADWSLYYTRQAGKARSRADRAAPLHQLGTLIREVAAAQAASMTFGALMLP